MRANVLLLIACLAATALAGCADPGGAQDDGPKLDAIDVTSDTGGIRGVVVDTSIVPVAGATLRLNSGQETTSDEQGVFTFTRLEPGTYFITAEKLLYEGAQTSTQVVAGVAEPPVITIQIARLEGVTPYLELTQFDGFYDCAFAGPGITDSCDMAVRTLHDFGAPVPRNVQNNVNTGFIVVGPQVKTIIQQGYYDDSVTTRFWTMLSSTPIDNGCDCSDVDYLSNVGDDGTTYDRRDRSGEGAFPAQDADEEVAVRGFIPWATLEDPYVDYALSLEFQIFTSLFHNYEAQDGWTLEERDQYPVPS